MRLSVEEIKEKLNMPQLEGIAERLEEDLAGILNRAGIYFRIFSRAKTPYSLMKKIEKGDYGFGDDEKRVQDLIGLRVVVYYYDDIPIVRTILEKTFRRIGGWSKTVNTEEEFKASKLNGIFRIPEEYRRIFSGDLSDIPVEGTFEVQLRTVSFEGWHEIEHDMRYKSPHGEAFWEDNEELSRIFNSVLANMELCDWSTVSIFDKLSLYHFRKKNWGMMLKSKFRLRFGSKFLDEHIKAFLDDNPQYAYDLYSCSRSDVIFALLRYGQYETLTYDLLVKVANQVITTSDDKKNKKLAKICESVVVDKVVRLERQELMPLEATSCFNLNVILVHDKSKELTFEFAYAVSLIGQWAQTRFRNITDNIPDSAEDFEFHDSGYSLRILGNTSLGIYRLTLEHMDIERKGIVWRTNVSLEMSDKIRMKVDCDYCHQPNRMIRDSFSKPRFVDDIFKKIGYEDIIPMTLKPHKISNMKDLQILGEFTTNTSRTLPVILAVEETDPERQVNVTRLAETVGTYAHVFLMDKKTIPLLAGTSGYSEEELVGSVWVTFRGSDSLFYTRDKIADSRFDFNKYAFDQGNENEKAFRHKLVRLIKERNANM